MEKDVLDLGQLLSTSLGDLATQARDAQQFVRIMKDFRSGLTTTRPRSIASCGRGSWPRSRRRARSLISFTSGPVGIMYRTTVDEIVEFARTSCLYRMKLLRL